LRSLQHTQCFKVNTDKRTAALLETLSSIGSEV